MTQKQIHVLVVDDESAIRDMITFALKRAGMQCTSAADAQEALVAINENRPDLILMDWMMPGVSGIELTRRLRKDSGTADIPIIMLTARVTEDDTVAGLEAGTDDYIIKPFSPRELMARIRAVIRRSSPGDSDGRIEHARHPRALTSCGAGIIAGLRWPDRRAIRQSIGPDQPDKRDACQSRSGWENRRDSG